ncbi:MAG: FISUMP domain-containing protein [Bacteroidota bacterium]|nr:FISUMP domain-containing protein [Bacteroidota bacterium]
MRVANYLILSYGKKGRLRSQSGFNTSGFNALPGGYRKTFPLGSYYYAGSQALFWTATGYTNNTAVGRKIGYDNSDVYRYHYDKNSGFSVRCVKD